MSKKLEGNGLWESSRMMLPEHKASIIANTEAQKRKKRKELDEQEWESVSRFMAESIQNRQQITIHMFHPIEELIVIGVVNRVDNQSGRFSVDGEWFLINDIVHVETEDSI